MRTKTCYPQITLPDSIKLSYTTYDKLLILLCYHALRISDPCPFPRSQQKSWAETSSHQMPIRYRMGTKKEKPAELCETTAQKGLSIAKATLALQESVTYSCRLPSTPKGLINQSSPLPVDLKNSIGIQIASTITFWFISNFYGLGLARISVGPWEAV